MLERHADEVNEHEVEEEIIKRIDDSCLLNSDIETIDASKAVRPSRWRDYIFDHEKSVKNLKFRFPDTVPFRLIDNRIIDLAMGFRENADSSILAGYRRLEDIVRDRTDLKEAHGSKLFSKAFVGENSKLYWKDLDSGENSGKGSLFTSMYTAFRNRRAHRELLASGDKDLREFLLLNELFLLEEAAVARPIT
jgi:hypothetical protein